ncbi:MAG: tRNA (adenosine(37)-N6)-dimethylallyltransferase MiaA [Allomuricauda sp.]|nr:MAG: tRNA (adenosine(37)-N6)-dimethylallyltransferase MiaA [Allomuricauda sp.]
MKHKTLLAIVGPTGIGKTHWAIQLAKHFHTEILSADSRQFYKEMTIGTAVPSASELGEVKHHFIQHKSIFDTYSVGDFEKDALAKLNDLFRDQELTVIAGGSGLYVDAVVNGMDDFPDIDPSIRNELIAQWQSSGIEQLQIELKEKDPVQYNNIDLENPHRLIRALEVTRGSGKPYSSFLGKKSITRPFKTLYLGIQASRETIYERIERRVDQMMQTGLLDEAKKLFEHKNLNALQTVGYKELFQYLDGAYTLEFAISEIKKNTRRYAKRQLTWYRKNDVILWIDFDAPKEKVIEEVTKKLNTLADG